MDDPLVSVIIPVYNAEKYVAETIRSVIDQTWSNWEIIIVDDGSTDESLATASGLGNENIKIISQKNSGASAARNRGLSESRGEYIQFLDADDLLTPTKIENQVKELIKHKDCVAVGDTVHFVDGTNPYQLKPSKEWYADGCFEPVDFLTKLYGGHVIGENYGGMIQPNSWLTPRNLIESAGPWNETLSVDDDGEFFCRVILAGKGVCYTNGAVNYYRKFEAANSLSAQKGEKAAKSLKKALDLKAGYLLSKKNDRDVKRAISRLYWDMAFTSYPLFKTIAKEAEKKARDLAPELRTSIFTGNKLLLSKLIGWKAVRYFQFFLLKQN